MPTEIYRLDGNLYRWNGAILANGWPVGVESFVKDAGTRQIVGRWLDCPNWGIAKRLRDLGAKPADRPHKIMTPEEYQKTQIKGWHQVCQNVDGFGNVGILYE